MGSAYLTKNTRDAFVKNVSAVAGVALKGVPRGVAQAAAAQRATGVAERCAKAKAAAATVSGWESVSAAMLEWRRLSSAAATSSGGALQDLRECWELVWARYFAPELESLARGAGSDSVLPPAQRQSSCEALAGHACEWLDGQAQAKVAPADAPDPVRAQVAFAQAFCVAGASVAKAQLV